MAYEKQTWVSGEVITADKLNHIEDGIAESGGGGSTFIIHATMDGQQGTSGYIYYDEDWADIVSAYNAGTPIYIHVLQRGGTYPIVAMCNMASNYGSGELQLFFISLYSGGGRSLSGQEFVVSEHSNMYHSISIS